MIINFYNNKHYYKVMEIRDNEKVCIIAPICEKIDSYKTMRIMERIKSETRRVAIDLNCVQDCTIDFIEAIKSLSRDDLGIFNIPSDLFALFNVMSLDKSVKLYVSELDFESNSHQLINRKFALI